MPQPTTTDKPEDKQLPDGDAGTTETPNETVDKPENGGEQMITIAEAQKRADAQVAKKLKGMPSKEELAEYKAWKESQKSDDEKRAEAEKRYAALEAENTSLKQEKMVLAKGVSLDDADYVLFKVSRMEGDFEDNLTQFLTDNPKYTTSEKTSPARTGVSVQGSSQPKASGVDEILKKRNPNLEI